MTTQTQSRTETRSFTYKVPEAAATELRLRSCGHDLDVSPECFGTLRDSSDVLNDESALRERMQNDGYLYLPDYLNRGEVLEARGVVTQRLAQSGVLDEAFDANEAVAARDKGSNFSPDLAIDNAPLMRVLYAGRMIAFYERLLGEDVRHFDFTWMRTVAPGVGTFPHCDMVYMGRGTQELYTSWTPLGDTSFEMGGLMILEGSHGHAKLRENYCRKDVDAFCANRREADHAKMGGGGNIREGGWLSDDPVKLQRNLGGRWLSSEFRAGDLLAFSTFIVHASLDNQSKVVRLSSDSRYQRASEPADERWIGANPVGHGVGGKRGMIC